MPTKTFLLMVSAVIAAAFLTVLAAGYLMPPDPAMQSVAVLSVGAAVVALVVRLWR